MVQIISGTQLLPLLARLSCLLFHFGQKTEDGPNKKVRKVSRKTEEWHTQAERFLEKFLHAKRSPQLSLLIKKFIVKNNVIRKNNEWLKHMKEN